MQEIQFLPLVQEDPTCHRATKPMCHNYWACVLEPGNQSYRSQGYRKPSDPQPESSPHSPQLEKSRHISEVPAKSKTNKIIKKQHQQFTEHQRASVYPSVKWKAWSIWSLSSFSPPCTKRCPCTKRSRRTLGRFWVSSPCQLTGRTRKKAKRGDDTPAAGDSHSPRRKYPERGNSSPTTSLLGSLQL